MLGLILFCLIILLILHVQFCKLVIHLVNDISVIFYWKYTVNLFACTDDNYLLLFSVFQWT